MIHSLVDRRREAIDRRFHVKQLMFVMLLSLPAIGPANAVDSDLAGWSGAVLRSAGTSASQYPSRESGNGYNLPAIAPEYRLAKPEKMAVRVVSAGGTGWSWSGYGYSDISRWVQVAALKNVASLGTSRGVTAIDGQPQPGQLVLEIDLRVVSGGEFNRESERWERWYESTDNNRSAEYQTTYLTLQPAVYRLDEGGQREVVAAPAARISASETATTGTSGSRSYVVQSWWHDRRYDHSRWQSRGSSSWEWRRDAGVEREMQLDTLSQRLTRDLVSLVFSDLSQRDQRSWVGRASSRVIRIADVDKGEIWLNCGPERGLRESQELSLGGERVLDPDDPSRVIRIRGEKARLKIVRFAATPSGEKAAICTIVAGTVQRGEEVYAP